MAYISVPNSFVNGQVADANKVNSNFNAILEGLSDGTKDINVSKLDLSTLNIPSYTTAPSSPVTGELYLNTTDGYLNYFDGTSWVAVSLSSYNNVVNVLDTVDSLRTSSYTGIVYVRQYYTPYLYASDKNSGGVFIWDAFSTDTDDNGVVIKKNAISTGRWIRVLPGYVTPRFFGAIGSGTNDDYTAIAAAVSYCYTNNVLLKFDEGTYLIGTNLSITCDFEILPGALISHGTTTISVTGKMYGDPLYRIFSGTGSVTFGTGSVKYVRPEYFYDGSGDYTLSIEQAQVSASNCGYIKFGSGTYTTEYLKLRLDYQYIGNGEYNTVIQHKAATNGNLVTLYNTHSIRWRIQDLCLDGNRANQTTENNIIHIDQKVDLDLVVLTAGGDYEAYIKNVLLKNSSNNAIYFTGDGYVDGRYYNVKEITLENIYIQDSYRYGMYLDIVTDSFFSNVTILRCGSSAVYADSCSNNRFMACKCFYCGAFVSNDGGFVFLSNTRSVFNSCQAQENTTDGFYFYKLTTSILSSCVADANGRPSAERIGFKFVSPVCVQATLLTSDFHKAAGSSNWQDIGLVMTDTEYISSSNYFVLNSKYQKTSDYSISSLFLSPTYTTDISVNGSRISNTLHNNGITVEREDSTSKIELKNYQNSSFNCGEIFGLSSRGTKDTPLPVASSDRQLRLVGYGYDGTNQIKSTSIELLSADAGVTGIVRGRIDFGVMNYTGAFNTVSRIDEDQFITYKGLRQSITESIYVKNTPCYIKKTLTYSDFLEADNTKTIELDFLLKNTMIKNFYLKHSTAFSGGTISAYTISVGNYIDPNLFIDNFDVMSAVAEDNFILINLNKVIYETSGRVLTITARSTTDTLDHGTAGSVDVYFLVELIS